MDEQLDKRLADFLELRVVHVCDEQLVALLREAIRCRVVQLEEAIAGVAAHQHGVITWEQLIGLGLKRGAIESWVRTKRLHRIYRGVFLLGNPSPAQFAMELGAVLACGKTARLSHKTSLAVDDVMTASGDPHVTVVARRVTVNGVRSHATPQLHPSDTKHSHGIPMVSTARALLEIAATHDPATVADAVEKAQIKRLVTHDSLKAAVERAPRKAGVQAIRDILLMPQFTRSRAERTVLALCEKAGLPLPETNQIIDGDEVDFLWRGHRVTLEFDSYAFHATRAAFQRDRKRDADRLRAGYIQLRTTWWELNQQPFELVARIAETLARAVLVTAGSARR